MVIKFDNKLFDEKNIRSEIQQRLLMQNAKLAFLASYAKQTEFKVLEKYLQHFAKNDLKNDKQLHKNICMTFLPDTLERENEFLKVFDCDSYYTFFEYVDKFCGDLEKNNAYNAFSYIKSYNNILKNLTENEITEPEIHHLMVGKFTLPVLINRLELEKKICKMLLEKNAKLKYEKDLNFER